MPKDPRGQRSCPVLQLSLQRPSQLLLGSVQAPLSNQNISGADTEMRKASFKRPRVPSGRPSTILFRKLTHFKLDSDQPVP